MRRRTAGHNLCGIPVGRHVAVFNPVVIVRQFLQGSSVVIPHSRHQVFDEALRLMSIAVGAVVVADVAAFRLAAITLSGS